MPHRVYRAAWRPSPPQTLHPWGDWVTQEIDEQRETLYSIQTEIFDQAAELERRRLIIETAAAEKAASSRWLTEALKPHVPRILFGMALILASWMATGKVPDPLTVFGSLPAAPSAGLPGR